MRLATLLLKEGSPAAPLFRPVSTSLRLCVRFLFRQADQPFASLTDAEEEFLLRKDRFNPALPILCALGDLCGSFSFVGRRVVVRTVTETA